MAIFFLFFCRLIAPVQEFQVKLLIRADSVNLCIEPIGPVCVSG